MESQSAIVIQTQQEVNQLEAELESKLKLITELEEEVAQAPKDAEISALKDSLSNSEATTVELQKANQELTLHNDQLKVSQQDARDLKESQESIAAQLRIAESNLVEKNSEVESLRTELSEQAKLNSVVASQKTEILSLKDSLSATDSNKGAVQRDLDQTREQLEVAQKTIEDVNKKANEVDELLNRSRREARQWEEESVSLKQLIFKTTTGC